MSEEIKGSEMQGQEDLKKVYDENLKNIKAEFNRKLENLHSTQQELINAITAMYQKPNANEVSDEDIDNLLISNPKKAAAKIKKEAKEEILQELTHQNQVSNEQQAAVQAILNDYPELGEADHPLTQKTLQLYEKMSAKEKASPLSYKIAAREAADELGILPKKRRQSNSSDDFSLKGSSMPNKDNRKAKVDDHTLAFAQAMGLNVNDKEVLERLSKHSKRNFLQWS